MDQRDDYADSDSKGPRWVGWCLRAIVPAAAALLIAAGLGLALLMVVSAMQAR
jgi:hypothetical protein